MTAVQRRFAVTDTLCSFCGISGRQIAGQPLIAGPKVYICAGCVQLCADLTGAVRLMPAATLDGIDPPVVAALLRRAADEFMHHGCNDFDLAAVLPDVSDRRELMRRVNEWNNSPGDFDPEGSYRIVTDWVLMRFLATKTCRARARTG